MLFKKSDIFGKDLYFLSVGVAGLNSYKCIYINCNLSARGLFLLIQSKFTHKVKHNIKQLGHVCFIVSWYQNYQSVLNQWQYIDIKIYYWEIICSIGVLMRSFSNWVIYFRNFDCKVMYDLRFHQLGNLFKTYNRYQKFSLFVNCPTISSFSRLFL